MLLDLVGYPDLAVTSPRLSSFVRPRFIDALVALVASQPIFFPILETEAISRNPPGYNGARSSNKLDAWISPDAKNRYSM